MSYRGFLEKKIKEAFRTEWHPQRSSRIEIFGSSVLLVGGDPFGKAIANWLTKAGSHVMRSSIFEWVACANRVKSIDVMIVAEHQKSTDLLSLRGAKEIISRLAKEGAPIVHLCGLLDKRKIEKSGGAVIPRVNVPPGVMSVTTAYAGPFPVIRLHAAGLKVGQLVVNARKDGASIHAAINTAVASGFGKRMGNLH